MPVVNENLIGISNPAIATNNFELKPTLINMVQHNQFGGMATEDPNIHLEIFLEVCVTMKMNGVSDDAIRLHLFPFSLRDRARSWLQSLPLGSINTWDEMIAALSNQVAALKSKTSLSIIESIDDAASQSGVGLNQEQAQYVSHGNYNYLSNNMPNYYHPGLRNHEKFSYNNNKNVLQPPSGFNAQPQAEKMQSFGDILGTFMMETNKRFNKNEVRLDNIKTHMSNMGATMNSMAVQVGQLATTTGSQQKGDFPSYTEVNPKEQCKAIYLRIGKEFEGVFLKKKLDEKFAKFLEIVKKINIDIPFVDSLEQMPNYVKFMKEVMLKKRNFEDYKTMKLTKECSAILKKKLPQKLKDPGNLTIPCNIGGSSFDKALCDLGASINLILLSIFKKLGLGEVKPTTITLQLVDRSFTYPHGVIKYVLVTLDQFVFPAYFVVLDMEEDHEILLILGHSFLATDGALIDVQAYHLTLRVNEEKVRFDIYNDGN
ncbi:uncharacterized protein LOC133785663 [Humulus lupulus]|uniref:uncharacterized protein LOC133785663 n=1 Tax=Humulus lupulus TaxID=3486 RepID=UPI002B412315|nr:uncharacterized protein LOC133785663 [Humulus lupulus]